MKKMFWIIKSYPRWTVDFMRLMKIVCRINATYVVEMFFTGETASHDTWEEG